MQDKKEFFEGERVVPSDAALRTFRHALRPGTVGIVLAPTENTAANQVRVEILDDVAVAALDQHRGVSGASRIVNWHQNWWTKASDPPTRLRRHSLSNAASMRLVSTPIDQRVMDQSVRPAD